MLGPRLDSVTLDTASVNVIDLSSAPDVESCECPQGYMGMSCEVTSYRVFCGWSFHLAGRISALKAAFNYAAMTTYALG